MLELLISPLFEVLLDMKQAITHLWSLTRTFGC